MLKRLLPLLALFIFSATLNINAKELKVPALTGRVVDTAGLLSPADKSRITSAIRQFETATKGQMAVLIIPSLKGDSLEGFSIRVVDKWKLGDKKRDDGILLLISVKDHKIRLEVGYGFEGNINDARAGDIIRAMAPYFRAGKFTDGIIYAVAKSQEYITGKPASTSIAAPPHSGRNTNKSKSPILFRIFVFFIIIIIIFTNGIRRPGIIFYGGGFSSGGGGFGGGGFSGGGGGFGGGGASGGW